MLFAFNLRPLLEVEITYMQAASRRRRIILAKICQSKVEDGPIIALKFLVLENYTAEQEAHIKLQV